MPQIYGTSVDSVGQPLNFNNCWYVGLAPLALALLAVLLRRERRVAFLGATGLLAFGIAADLPFVNLLHRLPGLQAQLPERTAYLLIVCAAVLAGLGYDALRATLARHPGRVAAAAAVLGLLAVPVAITLAGIHAAATGDPALSALQTAALRQAATVAGALLVWAGAAVALRGGRGPRAGALLGGTLLALTAGDLLTYAPGYNTYVRPDQILPRSPAAAVMRAGSPPARLIAPDSPNPLFVPNESVLYGLQDVAGYDSLHLARYEEFWAAADPSVTQGGYFNAMIRPRVYTSTQAALLNAGSVAMQQPLPAGALPPTLAPLYSGGVTVYSNTAALPRAFIVGGAHVLPAAGIPAALDASGFDPRRTVLLEAPPPPALAGLPAAAAPPGTAGITRYRNLEVDVAVTMDRPGWLVLGDVNYPGWQATVDGRAASVYTADYLLRAVPLPAGTHTVAFVFRPASVAVGGAISAVALLAAAGVLGGTALRRRRGRRGASAAG